MPKAARGKRAGADKCNDEVFNWQDRTDKPKEERPFKVAKPSTVHRRAKAAKTGDEVQNWQDRTAMNWQDRTATGALAEVEAGPGYSWQDRTSGAQFPNSCSNSPAEPVELGPPSVDFTLEKLKLCSLDGDTRLTGPQPITSSAGLNGISRERLRTLQVNGACSCKKKCIGKFTPSILMATCTAFWSLPSDVQSRLLHTLYDEQHRGHEVPEAEQSCCDPTSGWQDRTKPHANIDDAIIQAYSPAIESALRARSSWHLSGIRVCFEAFYTILGIAGQML